METYCCSALAMKHLLNVRRRQKTDMNSYKRIFNKLKSLIENMYPTLNTNWNSSSFYLLPKVHNEIF